MVRPNFAIFRVLDDAERQTWRAVIEVYKDFHEKGQEPGAEHWSTNEYGRATIDMRVRAAWGAISKHREHLCPYTRDVIVTKWITYRKAKEEEKVAIEAFANGGTANLF